MVKLLNILKNGCAKEKLLTFQLTWTRKFFIVVDIIFYASLFKGRFFWWKCELYQTRKLHIEYQKNKNKKIVETINPYIFLRTLIQKKIKLNKNILFIREHIHCNSMKIFVRFFFLIVTTTVTHYKMVLYCCS